MNRIDTREWLLTNGLGSFASGTVCDAHTRTYHGWLMAALDPPSQRTLLLAKLDATLELLGSQVSLGTNFWTDGAIAPKGYQFLQSFQVNPVPTWVWAGEGWQLSRQILMPYGIQSLSSLNETPTFCHRVLVRYCYQGQEPAVLKLRLLVGDRDFHHQQQQVNTDLSFSQIIEPHRVLIQALRSNWQGTPWQLCWTQGTYQVDKVWYWRYQYPEETQRGLADSEDLFSPGFLVVPLNPTDELTLEARVRHPNPLQPHLHLNAQTFDQAIQAERDRLHRQFAPLLSAAHAEAQNSAAQSFAERPLQEKLLAAGDQFIAYRASISGPTVIAGYPWFNDWGRDTLIALPGLALATQRFDLARGLLDTFGQYCQHGLIPNAFPDAGAKPFYNSIDAALWWIETLGLYLEATQDLEFLIAQYPTVQRIYKGLIAGTLHNIRVDAFDGLVTWDAPGMALTWMDAVVDGKPITPRHGKPVEINALWYSALCWANQWATLLQQELNTSAVSFDNQARRYARQAEQVRHSLRKFWNPELGYFYDTIEPSDRPDASVRPNAVIALSLRHVGFPAEQAHSVLKIARDRLLTPYGLRSLAPGAPGYMGRYQGDVQHRDRAYHQGTVWSWLIGPFIRAWQRFNPTEPCPWNSAPLLHHFQQQACLGSISEIFDGDPPHSPQGAIAQAWSVAEMIRHWDEIQAMRHSENQTDSKEGTL